MKNDSTYRNAAREAMESRFARSVAACLSESAETVAPDVAERLRFAREKSLEIARPLARKQQGASASLAPGAAILGFSRSRWWAALRPRRCRWSLWSAAGS